jgi:hypothetical protein
MTEESLQDVTRYARGIFMAGIVVILVMIGMLFWRKSNSVPVGEVVIAPTLTLAEAQQKVWFALPELAPHPGWQLEGVNLINDDWAVLRYVAAGGVLEVGKGTKRPMLRASRPYPREARKTTTVNGRLAIFIQGGWDENEQWNAGIDTALLEWSSNGFHYRIQHSGLGLNYQQMIDFGRTMVAKPESASEVTKSISVQTTDTAS